MTTPTPKDNQYGRRLTALVQGILVRTMPNVGQLEDIKHDGMTVRLMEESIYRYYVVDELGVDDYPVELNPKQAEAYAKDNCLTIVKSYLRDDLHKDYRGVNAFYWRQPHVAFNTKTRAYGEPYVPCKDQT